MSRSRTWEAAVNGAASLGINFGTIALGIACTPPIVAALGLHAYGLWALYSSIAVYFTLTDFGFGATFVKSIAEYHTKNEILRVRQVITFGLLLYVALGAVLVPAVAFLAPKVDALFRIDPEVVAEAPRLLVAVALYAVLSNAFNVFGQALIGTGSMRTVSAAGLWSGAVFYAVALVLLHEGLGIDALIVATFARLAVLTLQTYVHARRELGPLFCSPLAFEAGVIRYQFRMGAWIQVSNICSTINNEIGRFLVGALISVSSVSYFDVATRLTRTARGLPMNFSNALLPAMASLDAAGGGARMNSVYGQANRLFMMATALLLGVVAGGAAPIMRLWMGPGFEPAAVVAVLLCATYFVGNLAIVGSTLLRAVAKPHYETYYGLINAATNVAATLAFVRWFGLYGVAGGMLAGTIAGQIYFTWLFHRAQGTSVRDGLLGWIWKICAAAAVGISLDAAIRALPVWNAHSGRGGALLEVAATASVYVAAFAATLAVLRFFRKEELRKLWSALHLGGEKSMPLPAAATQ